MMLRVISCLALLGISVAAFSFSVDDPAEQASMQVLRSLERGELRSAQSQAHQLTQAFPNFKLGHLLHADILSIRQGNKPSDIKLASNNEFSLSNLRDEAAARWQRELYPPPQSGLPSSIAKLSPHQNWVIVNDLSRSRMYVFKNNLGEPQLVDDHYIGMGKAGYDKQYEGDHRTPLGVYKITSYIDDNKLPALYGAGAYPLNYPNQWDKLKRRTGHGIWIHGVPPEHYNRPPQSSEGCVTMNNDAFDSLSAFANSGNVRVINVDKLDWLSPSQWNSRQQTLLTQIAQWQQDWESLDTEAYLKHYADSFTSGSKNIQQWKAHKRRVNKHKSYIKVDTEAVSIFEYAGEKEVLQVNFTQDYSSDNISGRSKKSQLWQASENGWKIIYEGAAI